MRSILWTVFCAGAGCWIFIVSLLITKITHIAEISNYSHQAIIPNWIKSGRKVTLWYHHSRLPSLRCCYLLLCCEPSYLIELMGYFRG
jgi:hypothetical protein